MRQTTGQEPERPLELKLQTTLRRTENGKLRRRPNRRLLLAGIFGERGVFHMTCMIHVLQILMLSCLVGIYFGKAY